MTDMIRWELGADRIVVLTIDDPTQPTNTMTPAMEQALRETVDRLEAERGQYDGVILTSAKDTFFAGGDLQLLRDAGPEDVATISAGLDAWKASFRRLETLGRPVVAAINGTALGGGFEVALACHHRIALAKRGSLLGLPEVTLGVLPGAGGVTRTVRLLGVADAVAKVVGQGQRMTPARALAVGIVDEVVETPEDLLARARDWIRAHPDAAQPWDRPGYVVPGETAPPPAPSSSPMPAPAAVLATAVEGAKVDIDTAFAFETRHCARLICGQVSTNMIKALFFDLNAIQKGGSRPEGFPVRRVERVAVLGAGMMGAAIAYVAARAGIDVVLRDISTEAAERGKDYSRGLLDKAVVKGRMTAGERDGVLARILATGDVADVKGADLVVEAVFEDLALKQEVFAEVEQYVAADALLATNTSALPLGQMVGAVTRPDDFIGLHFFSPVDRMPLLEVVVGETTSDAALARALDFALQIRKTPIVVKDVYAFYANRVISQYVDQALSMAAEGAHPAGVERAALEAGYPVGPLALLDEVNMRTVRKIRLGAIADQGEAYVETPGGPLLDRMVGELDRPGRLAGRGFYEYAEDGRRLGLWPGLVAAYHRPEVDLPFEDMKERLLVASALEAARCLAAGIVRSVPEANVGSIMGIGFPAWAGGALQYVNQYADGPAGFVARADELRARYGDRFVVPDALRELAARGGSYL